MKEPRLHVAEAMRAAVFLWLGYTAVVQRPWQYAELPDVLRFPLRSFPVPDTSAIVVGLAAVALAVVCVLAALGSRPAAWMAIPLGWFVLGVPQMYGKVNHYHHLLWLAVLFAALPLASALRWTWPTLGVVYLFPGLAKLTNLEGLVFGDEMHRILVGQQTQRGWEPPFDITVGMGQWMAAGTVVFEVGFVVVAFTRWRRWAALSAVVFHLSVYQFTGIKFGAVLIPVGLLVLDRSEVRLDWQPVAVALLACAVLMGVAGRQGWPFAPYPYFHEESADSLHLVVMVDGREVDWLPQLGYARKGGMGRNIINGDPALWGERCAALVEGAACYAVRIESGVEVDRILLA